MQEKIGIVADVNSLYHASKRVLGGPFSYYLLMREIKKGRRMIHARACCFGNPKTQEPFIQSLRNVEFSVSVHQNMEVLRDTIASEIIRISPLVDRLVLLTNDRAMLSILDYVEDTNRTPNALELWFPKDCLDQDFHDAFDVVRDIDNSFIDAQQLRT